MSEQLDEIVEETEEEDKGWCVYIHTNTINGKKYVGQTCLAVQRRWGTNGSGYLHKNSEGEYTQPAFARAIEKYGWDNFEHEIVSENLSKAEADELEINLIQEYDTLNPQHGYNIREGGGHAHMSEESKAKLSKSLTGKFKGELNPMFGRKGELAPAWGRKDTEEQKKAKSERMKGENNPMYGMTADKLSDEARYNRGKARRGKPMSEEEKAKISVRNKKYYQTHEHHAKGTHRSEEYKKMMSEKMKGREFSEETKKKMSENHADMSGGKNPRAKAVRCIETGEEFSSAADAGRAYGLAPANPGSDIRESCKRKNKTAGKDKNTNEPLHWEWVN